MQRLLSATAQRLAHVWVALQGLSSRQKKLCDGFVYIPQHGPGTASLNVAVAAGIVLHHFAVWAAYPERAREGEKYVVAERPQRTHARGALLSV
jgi:tRNA C32,U32 (ribose-2'-O)-methylase TrmJ